ALQADSTSAPAADQSSIAPVKCRKILLVEDGLVNQTVAVGLLRPRGHTVIVANDGIEAVEQVSAQPFDLILMDVQMPRMDGFEATARIRKNEAAGLRRTPIIAMTAHAMADDRDRCLNAGMDAFLSKPVKKRELLAIVEGGWIDDMSTSRDL